jgi:hypothetical protein
MTLTKVNCRCKQNVVPKCGVGPNLKVWGQATASSRARIAASNMAVVSRPVLVL